MKNVCILVLIVSFYYTPFCQDQSCNRKFEQLGQELPTPNSYRAADGAPGPAYWQQKCDYEIDVYLNDENQEVTGSATITYYNNSPQPLTYLWFQLDQNRRDSHSDFYLTKTTQMSDTVTSKSLVSEFGLSTLDCGMNIIRVADATDKPISYTINKTMMRVDLPTSLAPGKTQKLKLKWSYNLNNRMEIGGRSGFEYFPEDGNYLYAIAQFYPRLAVYDDYEGWQNKQFLGSGEFTVGFGDFNVRITVPDDHVVAATGVLTNAKKVLPKKTYGKYIKAFSSFDKPLIIISETQARENEKSRSSRYQTWEYKAENVRDFAFTSSRKFIWDAQAIKFGSETTLAMSLYPKEGNPLWERESTKAVINTLKTYSHYSIDYPYPFATSVHSANIGMEYPMICFNFGRPNSDGSYSDGLKFATIGVIIHEVGHNFFPMIVNSDERQWGWMDEGINSYLEFRTEAENYENFPHQRGPASTIVNYMNGNQKYIRPIMTNAEQVVQLGNNAYGKPASALHILREIVMGPELFDKAFKTFSQRWAFKHPKPADFFRSMEDASGVDLDWFWRGWFYSTEKVDLALDTVIWYHADSDNMLAQLSQSKKPGPNSDNRVDISLDQPNPLAIVPAPDFHYWEFKERIKHDDVVAFSRSKNFYEITVSNKGGLVMPILMHFTFEDGTEEEVYIPAEIWRYNEYKIKKTFYFDKKLKHVAIDPKGITADVDLFNNFFPRPEKTSKFKEYKKN